MKIILFFLIPLLACSASAQQAPQPQPTATVDALGVCHVEWDTISGRTYFVRLSTNLTDWIFTTEIVSGNGQPTCYCFEINSPTPLFISLQYTDYPTSDPATADFDHDGFTNAVELQNGTSPFDFNAGGGVPTPPPVPDYPVGAAYMLQLTVTDEEADPVTEYYRHFLDAGFNLIDEDDAFLLSVTRKQDVTTEIQLFGDAGPINPVHLNILNHVVDYDPATEETEKSAEPKGPLTIPVGGDQSGTIYMTGDGGGTGSSWEISAPEITVVFGIGPDAPIGVNTTSREFLENYLMSAQDSENLGDLWTVPGWSTEGLDKHYGIEIMETEHPLIRALQAHGKIVVFDGHSNFGLGPNFTKETHKTIEAFTNFGANITAIPITYRGLGNEDAVHGQGIIFDPTPENTAALNRVDGEGWAYLVVPQNQIPGAPTNYIPNPLNALRFQNDGGIGNNQNFTLQGQGLLKHHYSINGRKRLIVEAPNGQLPDSLKYKNFFYNACSSGNNYIQNFQHGDYIYTTQACAVSEATKSFVEGIIDGQESQVIVQAMNNNELAGPNILDGYAFESFGNQ